jgi:hypothetical protein
MELEDWGGVLRFRADPLVRAVIQDLDVNRFTLRFLRSQGTANEISVEQFLVFLARGGRSVSGLRDTEDSLVGMNESIFGENAPSIIGPIEENEDPMVPRNVGGISIRVYGLPRAGKTTVALLIETMLCKLGVRSVSFTDPDNLPSDVLDRLEDNAAETLNKKNIVIEEVCLKKG